MRTIKTYRDHLLVMLALMIIPVTFAQEKRQHQASKKEKIEQLKIAFITKELDLTTDEAEKFWPVYNEMSKKLLEEKKSRKKITKELREGLETMPDEDIKQKTNSILDSDIKQAELKKEYTEKIADIIGYKKATKLLSLEQRFKRELLNKLHKSQRAPHRQVPQVRER